MAGDEDSSLGALIRARRKELRLSQAALAQKMSTPERIFDGSRISVWERNDQTPTLDSMRLLAGALEVEISYFGVTPPSGTSTVQAQLDAMAAELDELRAEMAELRRQAGDQG